MTRLRLSNALRCCLASVAVVTGCTTSPPVATVHLESKDPRLVLEELKFYMEKNRLNDPQTVEAAFGVKLRKSAVVSGAGGHEETYEPTTNGKLPGTAARMRFDIYDYGGERPDIPFLSRLYLNDVQETTCIPRPEVLRYFTDGYVTYVDRTNPEISQFRSLSKPKAAVRFYFGLTGSNCVEAIQVFMLRSIPPEQEEKRK